MLHDEWNNIFLKFYINYGKYYIVYCFKWTSRTWSQPFTKGAFSGKLSLRSKVSSFMPTGSCHINVNFNAINTDSCLLFLIPFLSPVAWFLLTSDYTNELSSEAKIAGKVGLFCQREETRDCKLCNWHIE